MVSFVRQTAGEISDANDLNQLQIAFERRAVSVKDPVFGATGDGVTDDTTAIHAARDAAGVGWRLFFPDGDYLVAGLNNNVANQVWEFAPGAKIMLADTSNAHTVMLTAAGASITGGIVDGNKANQTSGIGIAITAAGCTVDGTVVQNAKGYGIYGRDANRIAVRNARVIDSDSTGIIVQATVAGSTDTLDCRIEGCHVDRTAIGAGVADKGIQVVGYATAPYNVIGAVIANNTVRMPSNPTSSAAICIEVFGLSPRSKITGNATYGGGMGISVDASDFTIVSANTIYNQKIYGIEIAGSAHCAVTGNTVDGNALGTIGVICDGTGGDHNAITGNVITGVTSRPISIQNSPQSAVTGNIIKHAVASYCIDIISSGDSTVSGNVVDGQSTATSAVVINTCDGIAVTGNSLKDCTQNGVLITAASAVTLDDITVSGNSIDNCNVPVGTSFSGGGALGANCRAQANGGVTQNGKSSETIDILNNVKVLVGTGSPESVVGAGVGSVFHRTDGGAATSLYVKESGTSTTGWVAK